MMLGAYKLKFPVSFANSLCLPKEALVRNPNMGRGEKKFFLLVSTRLLAASLEAYMSVSSMILGGPWLIYLVPRDLKIAKAVIISYN